MLAHSPQLKDFILDAGLVSRKAYEAAEKEAEKKHTTPEAILLANGELTEDDLRRMESYVLGIPFIDLKGMKVDFETLSLIPEPIARRHNIVAYRKKGNDLEVAMMDTEALQSIEFLKKKLGLKILPRLTDADSIKHALLQYQKTLKDEFGDLIQRESASIELINEDGEEISEENLKKMAEDLPVVRIVNALLKHALIQNASDVHIEPMEKKVLVRYRIDGILHDAMTLPAAAAPSIVARIKVLSNLKLDEKRLPQDGRFKLDIDGEKVSFRVSTLPTYYGEKVVMRLLREGGGGYTMETLGFHGVALEWIHEALKKTTGMLLTTGPTGSGKTTTLYTMLDILNTPDVNISTIEDPIEYQVPRINQTQVKPDIGLTFSAGLRALMRQDPDIIMVGEIRDHETASLAINAALTGHKVLSTLHTNSAAGTIPRMMDMGAEPFLLVSTINVIIGQRLVRKLTAAREPYTLEKDELAALRRKVDLDKVIRALVSEGVVARGTTPDKLVFYKPKPSDESEDGYKGRIGIHEVMKVTPAIKELVMQGRPASDLEARAREEGMLTMLEDGIFLAARGITTIEEVLRVVSD